MANKSNVPAVVPALGGEASLNRYLAEIRKFPLLTLVSMRGEFGEGNPWQFPMGQAVEPVLKAMGVPDEEIQGAVRLSWGHGTGEVKWGTVIEVAKRLT